MQSAWRRAVLCAANTVFFGNGFPSARVILTPPHVCQGRISKKRYSCRNPAPQSWSPTKPKKFSAKKFRKGTPVRDSRPCYNPGMCYVTQGMIDAQVAAANRDYAAECRMTHERLPEITRAEYDRGYKAGYAAAMREVEALHQVVSQATEKPPKKAPAKKKPAKKR